MARNLPFILFLFFFLNVNKYTILILKPRSPEVLGHCASGDVGASLGSRLFPGQMKYELRVRAKHAPSYDWTVRFPDPFLQMNLSLAHVLSPALTVLCLYPRTDLHAHSSNVARMQC